MRLPSGAVVGPYLSGALFAGAWWLFVDAALYQHVHRYVPHVHAWHAMPGLVGSLGFAMISATKLEKLSGASMDSARSVEATRCWLFCGALVSFGAIVCAVWIFAAVFAQPGGRRLTRYAIWPGAALVLQTSALLCAALAWMWGRSTSAALEGLEDDEEFLFGDAAAAAYADASWSARAGGALRWCRARATAVGRRCGYCSTGYERMLAAAGSEDGSEDGCEMRERTTRRAAG